MLQNWQAFYTLITYNLPGFFPFLCTVEIYQSSSCSLAGLTWWWSAGLLTLGPGLPSQNWWTPWLPRGMGRRACLTPAPPCGCVSSPSLPLQQWRRATLTLPTLLPWNQLASLCWLHPLLLLQGSNQLKHISHILWLLIDIPVQLYIHCCILINVHLIFFAFILN